MDAHEISIAFNDFWLGRIRSNPQLADPKQKLTITSKSLENELRKAHLQGIRDGLADKSEPSVFEQIFGKW